MFNNPNPTILSIPIFQFKEIQYPFSKSPGISSAIPNFCSQHDTKKLTRIQSEKLQDFSPNFTARNNKLFVKRKGDIPNLIPWILISVSKGIHSCFLRVLGYSNTTTFITVFKTILMICPISLLYLDSNIFYEHNDYRLIMFWRRSTWDDKLIFLLQTAAKIKCNLWLV